MPANQDPPFVFDEPPPGDGWGGRGPRWLRVPESKPQLAVAVTLSTLLVLGLAWSATREDGPPVAEQLQTALVLLDDRDDRHSWEQAHEIAETLERLDYRDPDFAGAVEFILGITAFRDAQGRDEVGRERQYGRAARYLREAESRALDASRIPEWAWALGVCLHQLGAISEARPLLEKAIETYPPGRTEAAVRLIDIYLDLKTPALLEQALDLSLSVLDTPDLDMAVQDRVWLQRAQVFMTLGQTGEAEQALGHISERTATHQGTVVFRAQMLMVRGRFVEALDLLEPVANDVGLERTFARQASYLMGRCAEELGDADAAIHHHDRTARRYNSSHEGLAALLRAAALLRKVGRNEEALECYRQGLRTVRRPQDFRNRWLSLADFRQAVLDAWNAWVAGHIFQEAIDLSKLMPPLLTVVEARELEAHAQQAWAEHLEQELESLPFQQRGRRPAELRDRWRQSGHAYAELARALNTSPGWSEALWTSAEHYRKGRDFENALAQFTRFLDARPRQLLPLALVRRGEVLMDLDRLDEALEHFRRVIENHPTDPAAFEAEYLAGVCHLERDEPRLAEKAWRDILASDDLTPAAGEWRLALFSLGRLQYHTAARLRSRADDPRNDPDTPESRQRLTDAFARWQEAIRLLEEFLDRYPAAPPAREARYLLAKALQQSAEAPRHRLDSAATENTRQEIRRAARTLLERARQEFTRLRNALLEQAEADRLDGVGQRLLRECHFEIANTHFALEDYEQAVLAYSGASHRYPHDPHVLLAYIQMTHCYDHLGRPVEARSMLEQARILLRQMPEQAFQSGISNMTRQEWERWLDRARELHQSAANIPAVTPPP